MQVHIKKWGNSPAVRIPAHLMNAVHFQPDQVVEIREEGGKLVIESLTQPIYSLSELIEGITTENLQTEINFGAAVGRENW